MFCSYCKLSTSYVYTVYKLYAALDLEKCISRDAVLEKLVDCDKAGQIMCSKNQKQ